MKQILLLASIALALLAHAETATDVFPAASFTNTKYASVEVKGDATQTEYVFSVKYDEAKDRLQFNSKDATLGYGIIVTKSYGNIKSIEFNASSSNENIQIFGKNTPYVLPTDVYDETLQGTLLGTATACEANYVLTVTEPAQYVAIKAEGTAKAAAVQYINFTWDGTFPEKPIEVPEDCDGLILNEVCGDDGTGVNEDWIELYNPTDGTLDISGVSVVKTDEDGVSETLYTFPEESTLASKEYLVVEKGTHFTSGISNNKNLTITLLSPLGKNMSEFDKVKALTHNGSHRPGQSYDYNASKDEWYVAFQSTKGSLNAPAGDLVLNYEKYEVITSAEQLMDGMKVILVNEANNYAMSYNWDKTKDGSVYMKAMPISKALENGHRELDPLNEEIVEVQLVAQGENEWALKFGDTNNYLNDSRFLACTAFKNMTFVKKVAADAGTTATITFNPEGDAEISYGAETAGSIKFNLKNDGTSRFLNYNPIDKPEDHLAVHLYTKSSTTGVNSIASYATDGDEACFNLQGIKCDIRALQPGIYIMRKGGKTSKVIIR